MKKIRIGQVGLGRLGMHYAHNIHRHVHEADLQAVCSLDTSELENFKKVAPGISVYTDFDEMLDRTEMDAVVVVSSTNLHAEHIKKTLEKGYHVFSEKPLAQNPEDCYEVLKFAKDYQAQIAMVGFNRRYDASYMAAMEEIEKGTIGKPFLFRSQTVDLDTVAEFQLKFSQGSGGIFIDYNVHDIDLMRWFLNAEVSRVWSLGGTYKFPGFARFNDADYALSTCEMKDGSMAVFSAGRLATHGHDTYSEITGTEGSIRIGRPAVRNLVEIYDRNGIRRNSLTSFWERFEPAFLAMIRDFTDCILENRQPALNLYNATKASEVADACTRSFRTGQVVQL